MNAQKLKIDCWKSKIMREIFLTRTIYHGWKTKARGILRNIRGK